MILSVTIKNVFVTIKIIFIKDWVSIMILLQFSKPEDSPDALLLDSFFTLRLIKPMLHPCMNFLNVFLNK